MRTAVIVLLLLLIILTAGCSAEKYGGGVNKDSPVIMVKDIILKPSLQGSLVNLEGLISTQCTSNGCWFFLKDDTGQIYVDLSTKGFAIPPRINEKARVTGVVQQGQNGYFVIAYGVEIG